MKFLTVFGTRPEAIKMCPVIKALRNKGAEVVVCVTGQHKEMLSDVLDAFNVKADINFAIMKPGQTLFDINREVLIGMEKILPKLKPDTVLVHGDTTTTFSAALSCFYSNIPIAHVEAGLRTGNMHSPYPEEFNRRAVTLVADYNFAPTQLAADNLINEGVESAKVFVTGNTEIDALRTTVRNDYSHPIFDKIGDRRFVILTAHRRENFGKPFESVFNAVKRVADENPDIVIVYPVHPNPNVRKAAQILENTENIILTEPFGVLDFHNMLARCYCVLTDSGGIQEDAPALNKPVLVLRNTSERPEGIQTGAVKLVGNDGNNVYKEFSELIKDKTIYKKMADAENPYGDGHAAEYISNILTDGGKTV